MKRLYKILLAGLFLPLAVSAHGHHPGDVTYKKYVNIDYNVSTGATFNVDNKYGNITFHTWNNNEIKATVTITGYGNTQDEAQQASNRITIAEEHSANEVSMETQFNSSGGSSFWNKLFSSGDKSGKQYVHIDYDVYLPTSLAQLTVKNNYGDVLADDLPGNADIALNYGNYHINSVEKQLTLNINYSEGTVTNATNIMVKGNYSHFNASNTKQLAVHTNYSEFHLGTVEQLKAAGNYNDFILQSVNDFDLTSNYTDYKIGSLSGTLNANITYGDIKISSVSADFKGITMSGAYANLQAGISNKAAFRADIHLSYGTLKNDFSFKNANTVKAKGTTVFSGSTTNASANSPLIKVQGAYTDVSLHD